MDPARPPPPQQAAAAAAPAAAVFPYHNPNQINHLNSNNEGITYTSALALAIMQSENRSMTLRDIYAFLNRYRRTLPFLQRDNWRRSVRHTLSKQTCFRRIDNDGKPAGLNARRCLWIVDEDRLPQPTRAFLASIRNGAPSPFPPLGADEIDAADDGGNGDGSDEGDEAATTSPAAAATVAASASASAAAAASAFASAAAAVPINGWAGPLLPLKAETDTPSSYLRYLNSSTARAAQASDPALSAAATLHALQAISEATTVPASTAAHGLLGLAQHQPQSHVSAAAIASAMPAVALQPQMAPDVANILAVLSHPQSAALFSSFFNMLTATSGSSAAAAPTMAPAVPSAGPSYLSGIAQQAATLAAVAAAAAPTAARPPPQPASYAISNPGMLHLMPASHLAASMPYALSAGGTGWPQQPSALQAPAQRRRSSPPSRLHPNAELANLFTDVDAMNSFVSSAALSAADTTLHDPLASAAAGAAAVAASTTAALGYDRQPLPTSRFAGGAGGVLPYTSAPSTTSSFGGYGGVPSSF